ncbi:aminodeoxychorismate synthase component I [Campylobacter mucosalis]|uniref:aminodeoxychorismate synthase component I n=1 Tax=Campylobacter mucosalis TaxID=202 RepID=UPI00146FCA98|nr:aminodeoxychorismate synthase component I [Campylobacter mucosalis]
MFKKLLNSYKNQPFIALISYDKSDFIVSLPQEAHKYGLYFKFQTNKRQSSPKYELEKYPVDFEIYKDGFNKVRNYQFLGHSYLLNLCFSSNLKLNLSLKNIFDHANEKAVIYKENDFVCFTPEPFVMIENGFIHTFPMKGTIDANIPNAKEILLNNKKEISEQMMMVDLMRNDLSIVASEVKVERFRYVSRAKNLYQTSSHISGKLRENLGFGDIFDAILPAGSITGTPKARTCEIIDEVELENRGFYTGVFIYFDGKILKSYVLIRFIKQTDNGFKFFSGGGITLESDLYDEYDELKRKIYLPF